MSARFFGSSVEGVIGVVVGTVTRAFSRADAPPTTAPVDSLTPPIVLVEGNIGAGKSTLCASLERRDAADGLCVRVVDERVGEQLLKAFYANRRRYAFAMQLRQLTLRQAAFNAAVARARASPPTTTTVLDRSLVGDFAFALWNWASSSIDRDEWHLYCEAAGDEPLAPCAGAPPPPSLVIVYLHDDVKSCSFRQLKRDQHAIDVEYLRGIEAAYLVVLARLVAARRHCVVELHWAEYARQRESRREMLEVLAGRATLPNADELEQRRTSLSTRATDAIARLGDEKARRRLEDYFHRDA